MKLTYEADGPNVAIEVKPGDVLTEQQAIIVLLRDIALSLDYLGKEVSNIPTLMG